MRQRFKDIIIRHEGLKHVPYTCTAGKLSIGIGRNLVDKGITRDEALYLLDNDIKEATIQATQYRWWGNLNEARQFVVISMIFNLGFKGFKGFKKMIYHIQEGQYEYAAREMLNSKWANDVGGRAVELAQIMDTGKIEID